MKAKVARVLAYILGWGLISHGFTWLIFGAEFRLPILGRIADVLLIGGLTYLVFSLVGGRGRHTLPPISALVPPLDVPPCGHDTDLVTVMFHDGEPLFTGVVRVVTRPIEGDGSPVVEELDPQTGRNLLNMAIGAIERALASNEPGEPL